MILFPTLRPEEGGGRTTRRGLSSAGVPTAAQLAAAPEAGGRAGGRRAGGRGAGGTSAPTRPVTWLPGRRPREPLAWLTALVGVLSLLPPLPLRRRSLRHRGRRCSTRPGASPATSSSRCVLGIALMLVAGQLGRGKRRAWMVAVGLFALGAVVHVLKGPDPMLALFCVAIAMLVALVWNRDDFRRERRPGLAARRARVRADLRRRRARLRRRLAVSSRTTITRR